MRVNIKPPGAIIIRGKGSFLSKICLQRDGSYRTQWQDYPPSIEHDRRTRNYLTDTGNIILQEVGSTTTLLFDQSMRVIDSWQYQGKLIACVSGSRAVYLVQEKEMIYRVDIRSLNGEVSQLKSKGGTWVTSGSHVYACEHARTGKLVVINDFGKSLDIFSRGGKIKQRLIHQIFI